MIRFIVGACVLLLAFALPAGAGQPDGQRNGPAVKPAGAIVATYTGLRTGAPVPATPWPAVPVAACTMECCCQYFDGGKMTNQCKSRDDCINAGGLCRPGTDAKCN